MTSDLPAPIAVPSLVTVIVPVCNRWIAALVTAASRHDLVGGAADVGHLEQGCRTPLRRRVPTLPTRRWPLGFLPFAPASNLAVWKEVYRSVGGLATDYRRTHDVEFSWRAQLGGFDLGLTTEALVHCRRQAGASRAFLTGYDTVQLYRDYRTSGARRPEFDESLRNWVGGLVSLFVLLVPSRRDAAVRRLAELAGRLFGGAKFRIFLP